MNLSFASQSKSRKIPSEFGSKTVKSPSWYVCEEREVQMRRDVLLLHQLLPDLLLKGHEFRHDRHVLLVDVLIGEHEASAVRGAT